MRLDVTRATARDIPIMASVKTSGPPHSSWRNRAKNRPPLQAYHAKIPKNKTRGRIVAVGGAIVVAYGQQGSLICLASSGIEPKSIFGS
mmetsp:Transcript_45562/g.89020  ORF Transcript_45562/g.89020 Transcript_45562/m.89020 type:complete len:89 (-) Transcript_45562:10-276(-)